MKSKFFVAAFALAAAFTASAAVTVADMGTMTLRRGSTGTPVMKMQEALNACTGSTLVLDGKFGPATTGIVKSFQTSKALVADGLVGAKTKAMFAECSMAPVTPGTTPAPTMSGTEGTLTAVAKLGLYNTTKVNEGLKDVKVYAMEMTAKEGDQKIDGFQVTFRNTGSGSTRFSNVASEVSVWLNDKEIGRKAATAYSDNVGGNYSYRFTGMNGVITKDSRATLTVAVTPVSTFDTADVSADAWKVEAGSAAGTVTTNTNYISAVSANGRYRDFGSDTAESTIDFQKATGEAAWKVVTSSNNPNARTMQVSKSGTTEVTLLAFDVKAENLGMIIQKLPINVTVVDPVGGVTLTSPQTVVSNVKLYVDGKMVSSESAHASTFVNGTVTFGQNSNLEKTIAANTTAKVEIKADIAARGVTAVYDEGTTVAASYTTSGLAVEIDNARRDSVSSISGAATGEIVTLQTKGIEVSLVSATGTTAAIGTAGDIKGDFNLTFKVKALDEDMLVKNTILTQLAATAVGTVAGQGSVLAVGGNVAALGDLNAVTPIFESTTTDTKDTAAYFYVVAGNERTFTVKYENVKPFAAGSKNVEYLVKSINWTSFSDATSTTAGDNLAAVNAADFTGFYNTNLTNFKTGQKSVVKI